MKPVRRALVLLCTLAGVAPGSAIAQSAAPVPPAAARSVRGRVTAPSVGELVRMVLRAARHVDAGRVEALVRRARLSGLLPTLKASARRGLKQDLSSSSTSEAERLAAAVADDLSFEAALSFDLPRLVFAPEEVRLLSVERWLAGDQRRLVEEAIRLFFQRRKLLLEREQSPAADAELEIAIAEIDALLDALTDGAFSKALAAPPR